MSENPRSLFPSRAIQRGSLPAAPTCAISTKTTKTSRHIIHERIKPQQQKVKANSPRSRRITSAVGTPVTRRPPHFPGRAVFPHPVPRLYSLSRKAFALIAIPRSEVGLRISDPTCPAQVSFAGYVLPSSPSPCTWLSHAPSTMLDKTPQRPSVTSPLTVRLPTCSTGSAMRIPERLPSISPRLDASSHATTSYPGTCQINNIRAPRCQETMACGTSLGA